MNMNQGKGSVLVTGGAGYIGSHACKALANAGYVPVTLDNLSTGHKELVKWGPLEQCDLRDTDGISGVINRHNPIAVLHFAGLISVGESVSDPYLYFEHNVSGTLSLLQAMRAQALNTIVFSSSCAVHGIPESVPIRENMVCAPISPYGKSKWMVELMLADAANAYQLNAMILRYFNASGADPEGESGEMHEPETHLIPLALRAAREGRPFNVNGKDYPTRDGTCVRDYIHVTDLGIAHVKAMEHGLTQGGMRILNLGTGKGASIEEIIRAVEKLTGRRLDVRYGPRREGDPPELVADNSQARALLDFSPQHSDIHSIIATAWEWERKRKRSLK